MKIDKIRGLIKETINNVNENDEGIVDSKTGQKLNIGDVVVVNGLDGEFQIGIKPLEGKPFLVPFNMETKKPTMGHKIYLTSLNNLEMEKVLSFSDTSGGIFNEGELTERWGRKPYSTYGYKNDPRIIKL